MRQIEAQAAEWSLAPLVTALQAMRGVALIVAVTLVAELGDLRGFASTAQLMAYVGLVPPDREILYPLRRAKALTERCGATTTAPARTGSGLAAPGPARPDPPAPPSGAPGQARRNMGKNMGKLSHAPWIPLRGQRAAPGGGTCGDGDGMGSRS